MCGLLLASVFLHAFRIAVVGVHKAPARLAAWRGSLHGWNVTRIGVRNKDDIFYLDDEFDHVIVDRTAVTPHGETLLQRVQPHATHHYISSKEEAIDTMDGLFALKM